MENAIIKNVPADEYRKHIKNYGVFFNEVEFCELNKLKVDKIHYLLIFFDDIPRFGLIMGQTGEEMRCPFSAPYSYPIEICPGAKMNDIDVALKLVLDYCEDLDVKQLRFTFPPLFYDEHYLSGWLNSMYRNNFIIDNLNINYHYDLTTLEIGSVDEYKTTISKKAKKHLNKAISHVDVVKCESVADYRIAYELIKKNHDAKGRPTHMSFEDIMKTFELVAHDAFIARYNGVDIATMVFYQINSNVVQCIYSGYLLEYSNMGAMNLLFYYAISYYKELGYLYIDRAIATEDSVPNYGLCDFKESVGCRRSLKYTLKKDL